MRQSWPRQATERTNPTVRRRTTGVALFDARPSIGHNLQRAVDEIAAAEGVSNKVTISWRNVGVPYRHATNVVTATAVSGICTHLGCHLALDRPARELTCPCHNAEFSLTGQLIRHQLRTPPPALPRLAVREINGAIQIFAP